MKTTVRVSKDASSNKQAAVDHTGGFKDGWAAIDMSLTIQEIAEKWLEGHSIVPAKIKKEKTLDANWVSQQIFAVDIDNENGDKERVSDDFYVTHREALEMARRAGLSPALIYSSFSSTASHNKFRMVFVLDKAVTTREQHNEVTSKLYSAFMKNGYCIADTNCRDLARIFYGGTDLLYAEYEVVTPLSHINQLGLATVHSINKLRSKRDTQGIRQGDYLPESRMHSDTVLGATTLAMDALISGNPLELREILYNGVDSTYYKKENTSTVHANMNPYERIKRLHLHRILGVPLNQAFNCIMHGHQDKHPSAFIRQLDTGYYAYFCYTCYGAGKGQSLIDLIIEATSCGIGKTIEFVEIAMDIRLQTKHQLRSRLRCDRILRFIQSPSFRTGSWAPLYSYMDRRKILSHYRYYVEQAALYTSAEPMVGEGTPTFYESTRETSKRMHDFSYGYCTGIDKNSVSRKRNDLADLGLIGKSTDLDHPAYSKARAYQRNNGNAFHKEFLFIPELNVQLFRFALKQINRVKETGERAKYKTKASMLTARGQESADRVYAQSAGTDVSKFDRDFISFMMRTTARLCSKGWTTEEEVAQEIKHTSKFSGVKWRVGQFRPWLTNGEHYTLKSVSNDLRNKLDLPNSIPLRTKIIVPNHQQDIDSLLDQIFDISD
jgi:hypothetical protein